MKGQNFVQITETAVLAAVFVIAAQRVLGDLTTSWGFTYVGWAGTRLVLLLLGCVGFGFWIRRRLGIPLLEAAAGFLIAAGTGIWATSQMQDLGHPSGGEDWLFVLGAFALQCASFLGGAFWAGIGEDRPR